MEMYNQREESQYFVSDQDISNSITKVFGWMFLAVFITFGVGFFISNSLATGAVWIQNIGAALFPIMIGCIIGELVLVWVLSGMIYKLSSFTAKALFIFYAALSGVTFSVILYSYNLASIIYVFAYTAISFGALAAYGYFTKSDLSGLGGYLFAGVIGIMVASLINGFFLHSNAMDYLISYAGVVIFLGLTAFDMQKIKRKLKDLAYSDKETIDKYAIYGALSLYLDFINLFIFLLRILGKRK